jgi:hypothetical protein
VDEAQGQISKRKEKHHSKKLGRPLLGKVWQTTSRSVSFSSRKNHTSIDQISSRWTLTTAGHAIGVQSIAFLVTKLGNKTVYCDGDTAQRSIKCSCMIHRNTRPCKPQPKVRVAAKIAGAYHAVSATSRLFSCTLPAIPLSTNWSQSSLFER